MRRGQFSEKETQLIQRVENEFELFRYKMLSKSRKKIFDECNVIMFYSHIYEYMIYAEDIDESHIDVCLKCQDIIAILYGVYMRYEYLRYSRWEDIEELLDVLVRERALRQT